MAAFKATFEFDAAWGGGKNRWEVKFEAPGLGPAWEVAKRLPEAQGKRLIDVQFDTVSYRR